MVDINAYKILTELMEASVVPEIFISKTAEIVGMHTQTLRQYDRAGIVSPKKDKSPTRRYSQRDIVLLKEAKELSKLGINKEGIKYILDLQKEIIDLKAEMDSLRLKIKNVQHVFKADSSGKTIITDGSSVSEIKSVSTVEISRFLKWE